MSRSPLPPPTPPPLPPVVAAQVYYNIKLTEDGKAQATNVTGRNGAYVQGRRGGGIVLEEEDLQPKVAPKKKGVIRAGGWRAEVQSHTKGSHRGGSN